jgi:hypothetical protein
LIASEDPHAALGLKPGAGPDAVARAYRDLAKRFHPDRRPGDTDAARRMAEINAAYAELLAGAGVISGGRPRRQSPTDGSRPRPGGWLHEDVRRALGPELVGTLEPGEMVLLVTDAATWDSHRVRLALSDKRLLWLRDDSPTDRVRWLRRSAIARAEGRLKRPRQRVGELLVHPRTGKRLSFSELDPGALRAILILLGRS